MAWKLNSIFSKNDGEAQNNAVNKDLPEGGSAQEDGATLSQKLSRRYDARKKELLKTQETLGTEDFPAFQKAKTEGFAAGASVGREYCAYDGEEEQSAESVNVQPIMPIKDDVLAELAEPDPLPELFTPSVQDMLYPETPESEENEEEDDGEAPDLFEYIGELETAERERRRQQAMEAKKAARPAEYDPYNSKFNGIYDDTEEVLSSTHEISLAPKFELE